MKHVCWLIYKHLPVKQKIFVNITFSASTASQNSEKTGRKLGINTDARYRFERGVDPNFMLPGLDLATQMVIDFCGGEPSNVIVAGDPASIR